MGCTMSPLNGAAIHSTGTCSRLAPRVWKMRLTLAFCRAKPNCRPMKPKHMFQICQNDTNGLAGALMGVLCAPDARESRANQLMDIRKLLHSVGRTIGLLAGLVLAQFAQSQPATHEPAPKWWHNAVIYEIYPRSFQDSNGDGIGDLNGITQRLDYLQALGVDAIWISPMYPSPQVDFGYDISDYENVDPQYGTLKDFDRLVEEAKKRNIRVILDMVLNHTSDQHKWFIESASSRKNPKRDWYVWNDGKPGPNGTPVPPNNWESLFGGSAWEYMPQTKSFYYHKFYKQQPDLNWRNPAVEKAMFGAMRFWLDRGVAGFRLDAIPTLFEDTQLRDERELGGINAQGDP